MFQPVTVDFETFGILGRPYYPPVPVGVAIAFPGRKPRYYAWGHPTGNNCTWPEARQALQEAWSHPAGVLFQNAKFDVDVAEVSMGLPLLPWDKIHDTMYLIFLSDPHAPTFSLKPSAERILGMPPEEQDAVADWLIEHQPLKVHGTRITKTNYGNYIAYAPGDLVGKYAIGDVVRTEKLFRKLYPEIEKAGMLEAYNRERKLMPILLEMERSGVRLDRATLLRDVDRYQHVMEGVDSDLHQILGDINLDSGDQLAEALKDKDLLDLEKVPLTKTGKLSTARGSLESAVKDPRLVNLLSYRGLLKTLLNTFMVPWLEQAHATEGFLHTTWNSVKNPSERGTKTGRLSSTPNFQNIPNAHTIPGDLPALPQVRSYVIPHEGHILIDRDFSGQELRILGHFEGGPMLEAYQNDPWLDFHSDTQRELHAMGLMYERKSVKNTNFGLIYGMGVGALAQMNGMEYEEAKILKNAVLSLYPGLKDLYSEMKNRAQTNQPIYTWGGRRYYCEEPREVNGRLMTFDYKLVNVLIQGSAADCSKEALIRYHAVKHPEAIIYFTVHDQFTVSCPKTIMDREMKKLKEAMESIEFDVSMLSEGKVGMRWSELQDYDKQGELI